MTEHERGKVKWPDRYSQSRDYSGLRYGNCTPCDIDGLLEFGGKLFILLEFKLIGAPFPDGQRIAIEHLIDRLDASAGVNAVAILAEHETPIGVDIQCHCAPVKHYRFQQKWIEGSGTITVKQAIDDIRKYFHIA